MGETFFNTWDEAAKTKDVCAGKHCGNAESAQAFGRIEADLPKRRAEVLEVIRRAGLGGITNKEICAQLSLTPNAVSPRITELKIAGQVRDSGRRALGSAIWIAV